MSLFKVIGAPVRVLLRLFSPGQPEAELERLEEREWRRRIILASRRVQHVHQSMEREFAELGELKHQWSQAQATIEGLTQSVQRSEQLLHSLGEQVASQPLGTQPNVMAPALDSSEESGALEGAVEDLAVEQADDPGVEPADAQPSDNADGSLEDPVLEQADDFAVELLDETQEAAQADSLEPSAEEPELPMEDTPPSEAQESLPKLEGSQANAAMALFQDSTSEPELPQDEDNEYELPEVDEAARAALEDHGFLAFELESSSDEDQAPEEDVGEQAEEGGEALPNESTLPEAQGPQEDQAMGLDQAQDERAADPSVESQPTASHGAMESSVEAEGSLEAQLDKAEDGLSSEAPVEAFAFEEQAEGDLVQAAPSAESKQPSSELETMDRDQHESERELEESSEQPSGSPGIDAAQAEERALELARALEEERARSLATEGDLQAELTMAEDRIDELEAELAEATAQHALDQEVSRELGEASERLGEQIDEMQELVGGMDVPLAGQDAASVAHELADNAARILELEGANGELLERIAAAEKQAGQNKDWERMEERMRAMEMERIQRETRHNEEMTEFADHTLKRLQSVEQELVTSRAKIDELELERDKIAAIALNSERDLKSLREKFEELQQEKQTMAATAKSLEDIKSVLKRMPEEHAPATTELSSLMGQGAGDRVELMGADEAGADSAEGLEGEVQGEDSRAG